MSIEEDFLKIVDEEGIEWEICKKDDIHDNDYEYKEIEISKLHTKDYTFQALTKLMENDIKTNIHFIYSKVSHNLAMRILKGNDMWDGKVDIQQLNAVVFLLFKPAGAGAKLDWKPSVEQFKNFAEMVFKPECKFKVGMDSCLINHVINYVEPSPLQKMSIDTCEGARMSAYITPDARMTPCSFAGKSMLSDKLGENNTITDVWNNFDAFNMFRYILKDRGNCCPLNL